MSDSFSQHDEIDPLPEGNTMTVEVEFDLWKMDRFTTLGFSSDEIGRLLSVVASPHDVEVLLWGQNHHRTSCTHDQAIRIASAI